MNKTAIPQPHMYMVETEHGITGSHWTYYQEAYNPQNAVDEVRCYADDYEEIVQVAKIIKGWK